MSGAPCIVLCDYCAQRIGKHRDIEDVSMEFMGACSSCGQYAQLRRYEVGMSHAELDRRRRIQRAGDKNRKVSGERGRAERRSST
jgi:hypothetical protein